MLLFISCSVPSAICYHLVNHANFILHVFNIQTSAFMLSFRQPSNTLERCSPQTSAKPLHWLPSHSLCCTAHSGHAHGSRVCLLLLWVERGWSSCFFLFSHLSAAILMSFVSSIHLVIWWRGSIPGVFIQHTRTSEAFEHTKGIWELQ